MIIRPTLSVPSVPIPSRPSWTGAVPAIVDRAELDPPSAGRGLPACEGSLNPPPVAGTDRVVRFTPLPDGRFERADVLLDVRHAVCGDGFRCCVRDGALVRIDNDATEAFRVVLPPNEQVRDLRLRGEHLYLHTDRGLRAFDADSGALQGESGLDPSDAVALVNEGACVARGTAIRFLDHRLAPRSERTASFCPTEIRALQNDRVLLLSNEWPARLQVLASDGASPLDVKVDCRATCSDGRGRVYAVSRPERSPSTPSWREEDSQILCYDPHSDTVARLQGTQATQAVLPFADGRYLVVHKYIETPRLILFGPDGAQRRHFTMGDKEHRAHEFERFMLAPDEQSAWVTVHRTNDDRSQERLLIRLDLRASPGPPGEVDHDPGQVLYARPADEPFVPVVLADGRVAVFGERVELLEPDGRRSGASEAEAIREALSAQPLPPLELGLHGSADRGQLEEALSRFSYVWSTSRSSDAFELRRTSEPDEALHALGFADRASWQAAQAPAQMLDHTFRGAHELPLPPGFAGAVTASRTCIDAKFEGRDLRLPCHPPGQYVSAAVLKGGRGAWVAAGASDGTLYVYDLRASDPTAATRVPVGQPVGAIEPVPDQPALRAIAADGTAVLVRLEAPAGTVLEGPARRTAAAIVVEPSVVRIGNLALPRRSAT